MRQIIVIGLFCSLMLGCGKAYRTEQEAQLFLDSLTALLEPLERQAMQTYWEAATQNSDSLFEQYSQLEIRKSEIFSNPVAFQKIRHFHETAFRDHLLNRQVAIAYNEFRSNLADTSVLHDIARQYAVLSREYNQFQRMLDGVRVSPGRLREINATSSDPVLRQKAWEASKALGKVIEADFRKQVTLLNQLAHSSGFRNYYEMRLILQEEEPAEIEAVIEQFHTLAQPHYTAVKQQLDSILCGRFHIRADQLQPWHYLEPYMRGTSLISAVNPDDYYRNQDVIATARRFFNGMGFNVDEILQRSDLGERDNKYRAAFTIDISHNGTAQIMATIHNDESGMRSILHELGHAIHFQSLNYELPYLLLDVPYPAHSPKDKIYVNKELPYLLRNDAQMLIFEGVAAFFQDLTLNPNWVQQMFGWSDAQREEFRAHTTFLNRLMKLSYLNYVQVLSRFEKALYENPDQDLNRLWWDYVGKYQQIRRPANRNQPDWAANYHLLLLPLYYHNYIMGDLFAAQLANAIAQDQKVTLDQLRYLDNPRIGHFLREKILSRGKLEPWNEQIEKATGEKLNPRYFIEQL